MAYSHVFVAAFLLQLGAALLGLGIWLHASEQDGPFSLPDALRSLSKEVPLAGGAAIGVGGLFLVIAITYIVAITFTDFGNVVRNVSVVVKYVLRVVRRKPIPRRHEAREKLQRGPPKLVRRSKEGARKLEAVCQRGTRRLRS